ncbi:MAG: D-alanyl-D-alanine carboxypeptidase family protein, partial [Acetivibrio ethanolgignens]
MKIFNNRLKLNKTAVMKGISMCMVAVFVVGVARMAALEIKKDMVANTQIVSDVQGVSKNVGETKTEPLGDNLSTGLEIAAKSAVLMDAGSGTLLFSQNGDEKLPPASVTKIMTMLLAMEAVDSGRVSLTDEVAVSDRAASMGGSQMYMEPGEKHTLEELMKGISMVSANDAAVAVAEYLAGSVEIFVENMNAKAKELGMVNTNFVNTNGLPVPNHYTSAHDIAIMGSELIKHEKTHDWLTKWQDTINVGLEGKKKEFGLTN